MNLEYVREKMKLYTLEEIARGTGLSRPTVHRIKTSLNFTFANLKKVHEYIEANKRGEE